LTTYEAYEEVSTLKAHDGNSIFINWLGTTLGGQRKMYASEWGEDYLALHRMVPTRWLRHISNVYHRYGNERNGVYHIGYSRGGGIAANVALIRARGAPLSFEILPRGGKTLVKRGSVVPCHVAAKHWSNAVQRISSFYRVFLRHRLHFHKRIVKVLSSVNTHNLSNFLEL